MNSIDSLFAMHAKRHPKRDFLSSLNEREVKKKWISYGDFYHLCLNKSEIWQKTSIPPGSVVAIYAENSIEFLLATFSAIFAGYVPLMLSLKLPPQQLKDLIELSDCKIGISSLAVDKFRELKSSTNISWLSVEEFSFSPTKKQKVPFINKSNEKISGDETAIIMHTSGSTATPKLVPLSHNQILKNQKSVDDFLGKIWDSSKSSLCWLPLYHGFAFLSEFLRNAYVGAQMVIDEKLSKSPADLLKSMKDAQTDVFCAVPWIFENFVQIIGEEEKYGTSISLNILRQNKVLMTGGAPLDQETADFFDSRKIRIINIFGLTEAAGTIMFGFGSPALFEPISSLGEEFIETADSSFELVFKNGSSVIRAYLANRSADVEKIRELDGNNIFFTGDLFIKSSHAWSYVGRKDDLFKNKMGVIVNPTIFEQKIDSLPQVEKSCLIGRGLDLNYLLVEFKPIFLKDDFDEFLSEEIKKINQGLSPANRVFVQNVSILDANVSLLVTQKGNLKRDQIESRLSDYQAKSRKIALTHAGLSEKRNVKQLVQNSIQLLQDLDVPPDLNTSLIQIGFDSFGMIELKNQLQDILKISIPIHIMLSNTSISNLIDFIDDKVKNKVNESLIKQNTNHNLFNTKFQLNNFQYFMYVADKKDNQYPYRSESMLLQCPRGFTQSEICNAVIALEKIHPTLKTIFDAKSEKLYVSHESMISQAVEGIIEYSNKDKFEKWVQKNTSLVLNLYTGPLYKIMPVKLKKAGEHAKANFYILIVMHHIICDYLSMVILTKDLQEVLSHPDKDYKQRDYISELNSRHANSFKTSPNPSSFWVENFNQNPTTKNANLHRATISRLKGKTVSFKFEDWSPAELHNLLAKSNITMFTGLLGSWIISLFYNTSSSPSSLTPLTQRLNSLTDGLIGPYLHLALIPARFDQNLKLKEFFQDLSRQISLAYLNIDSMPLSLLHRYIKNDNEKQNLFLYRSKAERFKLPSDWTCHRTEPFYNWSRYSMYVDLYYKNENSLRGHLGYQTSKFSKEDISLRLNRFNELLKNMRLYIEKPIGDLFNQGSLDFHPFANSLHFQREV